MANEMGKITGFMEFDRHDRQYRPVEERVKHWNEFVEPLPRGRRQDAGRALHGLRHPLLSQRLPGEQPDPRLERPRLPRPLEDGGAQPALDQQLPRGDGPRVPGAVRGLLHAQHRRQAGHHQDDRVRHRRQGLRGRLDRAASRRRRKTGKTDRHRRLGTRRPRRGPAARARRPRGARLREERQARRPAALRHPRLQDGEAASSSGA